MEILIYSKSLEQLNSDLVNTSSKIFEIEFAQSLSVFANVSVVSYNADGNSYFRDVKLFPLDKKKSIYKASKEVIKKYSLLESNDKIIIAFGYDYRILSQLKKISKSFGAKLISYTFDTHIGAIANKKYFKRCLIDLYFKMGIKYLNTIDGIILFNEEAYKEMKLKIPFLISRVGVSEEHILPQTYVRNSSKEFRMIYSGTLIDYNSMDILIDTMSYLEQYNILLDIYGDGPLKDFVIHAAHSNNNIIYHGLISNDQINSALKKADLLINLRDTDSYVSKFAFPSKLIKYMASGIPVLTTKVISGIDFYQASFVIDNLVPRKISELIIHIVNNPTIQTQKSEYAKKYIKTNFLWPIIIQDVKHFFSDLSKDNGRTKPKI